MSADCRVGLETGNGSTGGRLLGGSRPLGPENWSTVDKKLSAACWWGVQWVWQMGGNRKSNSSTKGPAKQTYPSYGGPNMWKTGKTNRKPGDIESKQRKRGGKTLNRNWDKDGSVPAKGWGRWVRDPRAPNGRPSVNLRQGPNLNRK